MSCNTCDLKLQNLLCVSQLDKKLFYVKKLCEYNSVFVEFFPNTICVKDLKTRSTILVRRNKDCLYQLLSSQGHHVTSIVSYNKAVLIHVLLHDQLGHPHLDIVKHVARSMNKDVKHTSVFDLCNSCQMAKAHRLPITHIHKRSLQPFVIVHMDSWGPSLVSSAQGMGHFLLFL